MKSAPIRGILFDLDGTLLDTAADLVGSLNFLRAEEGHAPVDVADYRQYVSQGSMGLINNGLPAADADTNSARKARFLAHYAQNSLAMTRAFDGVEAMLTWLEQRAIPWGIVTNKPEYLTVPIIRAIGWQNRAACVICGDTLAVNKPHPAPVQLGCELLRVRPAETLMVGDDPRDLQAGEAAGTLTALVTYGYGAAEVLASGRRLDHLLQQPGDLITLPGLGAVLPV